MKYKIIRKSNALIEASYKLSTNQQKIILLLASSIKNEDEAFQPYRITVKEFARLLGLNNHNIYRETLEAASDLLSQSLLISNDESDLRINWLSSVEYFKDNGVIELCFDPKLKPYLLQLKERFTSYRLQEVIQLRSSFSIRIYELLKQYQKIGFRIFNVNELRKILGIEDSKYSLYSNFKNKVLLVAQSELAEKTNITFEIEEIKDGRKVARLKFIIRSRNENEKQPAIPTSIKSVTPETLFAAVEKEKDDQSAELPALVALLPGAYQQKESIRKLLAECLLTHGFDYVARNIDYTNDKSNAVKPGTSLLKGSNYRNYLIKALRGDFGLAYQEDATTLENMEKEARVKAEAEHQKNHQENLKIERERELTIAAREYLKKLDPDEFQEIEAIAVLSLPPETQKMAMESRITAKFAINRAMEKVIIERYLQNRFSTVNNKTDHVLSEKD